MIGAVVLAGGQGKRMQAGINKQYLEIEGRSVLSLAIESMAAVADGLIVVCAHGEEAQARAAVCESGALAERVQIVEGGKERQDSVRNALLTMPESWQKVLIHDGARPFVPQEMLRRILDATAPGVGVVPGTPVTDTIKRVDAEGFIVETPPRETLRRSVLWRRRSARCIWRWPKAAAFLQTMPCSTRLAENACAWWTAAA